jgi:hypothetical protein
LTVPDWTELTAMTVPDASSASGRYGTGNSLEKIANAGHVRPSSEAASGESRMMGLPGSIDTSAVTVIEADQRNGEDQHLRPLVEAITGGQEREGKHAREHDEGQGESEGPAGRGHSSDARH